MYYICKNPDVEKKILDEIDRVLPAGKVQPDNRQDLV